MEVVSERLKMAQIKREQWPLFYALHTNKKVISLCFDKPTSSELKEKFESRLEPWSKTSPHWLCLSIEERETGNLVGITGFHLESGIAEVGFMFLPEYQGMGYATESLVSLINYGKSALGLTEYSAIVTEGNVASERVLLKVGFMLKNVIPNAYEIGGNLYGDHIYYLSDTVR